MDLYTTEIEAIDPVTNEIALWQGPHVPGINFSDAQDYCQRNGLGYCKVTGKFVGEVDFGSSEVPSLFDHSQN